MVVSGWSWTVCMLFLGSGSWLVVLVPATDELLLLSCVAHRCLKATRWLLTTGFPNGRVASALHTFRRGTWQCQAY